MSAVVGAALKKIAVALLTNPKVLKAICGIVLGVVIIIIMPIIAVVSIFNGDFNIDTDRLQQIVVDNLSSEEQAKLQFVEDTMYGIEDKMISAGFTSRVKEAQVLYVTSLSYHAHDSGFIDKLVGCFTTEQTDEQLIAAINSAFGKELSVTDFTNIMNGIRAVYIDTSDYTDPLTKNNLDLVKWAIHAQENGWGYVYGTYGTVLDDTLLTAKINQYPDEVGGHEDFIRENWLGRRTADCVGLIKGYGWYNTESQRTEIASNGMPDIGADSMFQNATEKGTIDTIPEIPGLAVWHEGHIGIYIGNGEVIQAANTTAGVIRTTLSSTAWTHWLKVPYIAYVDSQEN